MTRSLRTTIIAVALLAAVAGPGRGQQYLYRPTPVGAEDTARTPDGVLVQEVTVRKGDTLYGLSRRFSGHGSYYSQILLFNEIRNPDLIYPGNVLRVPVSRPGAAVPPAAPAPLRKASERPRRVEKAPVATAAATALPVPAAAPDAASSPGQLLYERAVKAYRRNDYRTALELFERFLAEYPASPLEADADLYKAECYLKMSSQ